ncbi:MAG: S8 family serine peptidase [Proteobacteria bacterium]|nr:S8 family serine peptidase [Pseudomonadota bacterium]
MSNWIQLKSRSCCVVLSACLWLSLGHGAALASADTVDSNLFLKLVSAPKIINTKKKKTPVVIAIVDDGVRTDHQDIFNFIWQNPGESGTNNVDDDGNGLIDDLHGWDVADNNNDLGPPGERLAEFYHGTRLAGIITAVARQAYAGQAADYIRIMPVKAVSDQAEQLYVKAGFSGIQYAINAGADIILCSWTIGHISKAEEHILVEAAEKGILIISSAGNIPQEMEQYPAAYSPVLAVAAADITGRKTKQSTYGQYVDLAAYGVDISSADSVSTSAYALSSGSSYSAALAAAAAALIKSEHPGFSATEITACLLNSANPMPEQTRELTGKVGAGTLNIATALKCDLLTGPGNRIETLSKSKGFLNLKNNRRKRTTWSIQPAGEFKGIRFNAHQINKTSGKGVLKVYAGASDKAELFAEYAIGNIPDTFYLPADRVFVVLEGRRKKLDAGVLLEYEIEIINFSTLYCSGQKKIIKQGSLDDGSGDNTYSPASDCKWLITAPKGKVIRLDFSEFDTEAKTDFIYFFDGTGTHADIIGRFSGPEIPPELTSWHNQLLVWFVTNGQLEGQGWRANIHFVDPAK